MPQFHVIIPAAGIGSRMASDIPKQYLLLAGKPLIAHCIETFFKHPRIASIHVALSAGDIFWRDLMPSPASKLKLHYTGGETRAHTVLNTLQALQVAEEDWVLVHDAARPGLTAHSLDHLISTLEHHAVGGLLAMPVADTLKFANDEKHVIKTIPRAHLWQAQTPQMFKYGALKKALQASKDVAGDEVTDEAGAMEAMGLQPALVMGELRNLKVTYPQDLISLELLLGKGKT